MIDFPLAGYQSAVSHAEPAEDAARPLPSCNTEMTKLMKHELEKMDSTRSGGRYSAWRMERARTGGQSSFGPNFHPPKEGAQETRRPRTLRGLLRTEIC